MTPVPLLSQALEGFYMSRRADGYSPKTLEQYSWALSRLLALIGDRSVGSYTPDDLRRFIVHEQERKLSPVSIFHTWKAIRAFYKWASPEFDIPNVSLKIKQPPFQPAEVRPLDNAEIDKLLAASMKLEVRDYEYKPTHSDRNRLILLFLLDTGVRVGELSRLNVTDVNLDTCEVLIRPFRSSVKSKPRTVYIGKRTQKELWKYLLNREKVKDDPLFLSNTGRRMTPDGVKHLVDRISKRAGVKAHPHSFRHTFAIQFLRNGGSMFALQRLLGHSTLEMVKHYVNLSQVDLEQAHRMASPVDNWRL